MATTPLATRADVEKRLRRTLTPEEAGPGDSWISGLLEESSMLVTGYCGREFDTPVPDAVRVVTSRVAARGVTTAADPQPIGLEEIDAAAGPFRMRQRLSADATSGGGWLTRVDKQMLSPWVVSGQAFWVDLA